MIVVVSGIRDLAEPSRAIVRDTVRKQAREASQIHLGGAIGVDTIALLALEGLPVRKVVYVPFTLAHQPAAARSAIEQCADQVIELRLGDPSNRAAYLERNVRMLRDAHGVRADLLLAFSDGRTTGGTHYTMSYAKRTGIDVSVITVESVK
jgi:hypothetical protein